MENTYFNHFCELIDNNTPLSEYTANSLYYKLRFEISQPLKSEINKNLMLSKDNNERKYYLMFLLSEIERQDYIKDAGLNYIENHLKTYNVKLQDILDFKLFTTNPDFCYKIIDVHYKSLRKFSPEKDEAFLVQSDFVNYFCKIMADEIIDFINLKLADFIKIEPATNNIETPSQPFKRIYLDAFCKELANDNLITHNSFIHIFNLGIIHLVPYLQDEIRENIITLDAVKQKIYIDLVKNQLKDTPYYNYPETSINHWLKEYGADIKDFPEFKKGELHQQLNRFAFWQLLEEKEHLLLVDLQYDFFYYGAMIEAKKMISFIDELLNPQKTIEVKKSKKVEKPHSFTYNYFITQMGQVTDLMNVLKKNKLIKADTELTYFRKIFSGEEVINKIVWTGNISELYYFIKYLNNESGKIQKLKNDLLWFVAVKCFVLEDGIDINRTRLRKQQPPSNSQKLENIINNF